MAAMLLSLCLLVLDASQALAAPATQKTIQVRFNKEYSHDHRPRRAAHHISKRQTIAESVHNAQVLYYADVSVGTPAQDLKLIVDTGSSDVWMSWSKAPLCLKYPNGCPGGDFDPTKSSTAKELKTPFDIRYVDGTQSTGIFFTDDLAIGSVTVKNQQMGLAQQTTIGTGIMGVGFAAGESMCNNANVASCSPYPSLMEQLADQKLINAQAYSLWLDDLNATTGTILFGGVDKAKYTGDLIALPVLAQQPANVYTSFSVALTGFSISNGSSNPSISFTQPEAVILDSGTSLTYLPSSLTSQIYAATGATYSNSLGLYTLPCSARGSASSGATFDYSFGGSTGPTIKVPWSELIADLSYTDGSTPKDGNGNALCSFGIMPATGGTPYLLGDTFLRSAYVVYDLSERTVALAQTDFTATGSQVQEISSGPGGVPGVSVTAAGDQVEQTASAVIVVATATPFLATTEAATSTATTTSSTNTTDTTATSTSAASTKTITSGATTLTITREVVATGKSATSTSTGAASALYAPTFFISSTYYSSTAAYTFVIAAMAMLGGSLLVTA